MKDCQIYLKSSKSQSGKTRRYMSEYERLTAFTHTPDWFGVGKGPSKLELEQAGEMLAYGALLKANQNSDQIISQLVDALMQGAGNGDPQINPQVREQLRTDGYGIS